MSDNPKMIGRWMPGCGSPIGRQIVALHSDGHDYCIATVHAGNGRDVDAITRRMAAAQEMERCLRNLLPTWMHNIEHRTPGLARDIRNVLRMADGLHLMEDPL